MRKPNRGPGIGRDLTPQQRLACALRVLAREDWSENFAGHITWVDGTPDEMWVNPWGKWWSEVSASDIMRITSEGEILEGRWDVTPAVFLHTELHRARPDARVIVHNHPYWATLLAAMGEPPRLVHQNSCIFDGEIAFVEEYGGAGSASEGAWLAQQAGDATGILLANHGAVVTGATIEDAVYNAVAFERACHLTYDVLRAGREPREVGAAARAGLKPVLRQNAPDAYWDGAVRQLLRDEPDVLD